ncbi:MAG: ribosomal L7Ae/L30e/S12e/Gadd45 family protein [Clostridia bacterium]|nr:ribosomal L7Ae/L30e/S12e/Gadd45 family protein [Clostridia bacterium]
MERLKSQNFLAGLKQSKKAILSGMAVLAYIAEDADEYIKLPLIALCEKEKVEVLFVDTMKELAKACHVEVPTAVAVLIKEN